MVIVIIFFGHHWLHAVMVNQAMAVRLPQSTAEMQLLAIRVHVLASPTLILVILTISSR